MPNLRPGSLQERQSFHSGANLSLWLNRKEMFARKIRVEYEDQGPRLACPLKWLDSFSMRNFTNASVFDDTLPVSDGLMEIGTSVPLADLQTSMEDWFRRKSYLAKNASLTLTELAASKTNSSDHKISDKKSS